MVKQDPSTQHLFDWKSKPLNLCFFRGENQGLHRDEFKPLHFRESPFDFKFVVKNDRDGAANRFVGIEEQIRYKFVLNIDGYSVRDSFVYNLEFGAVILSLAATGNREFWFDDLVDGEHHILFRDLPHLIHLMEHFAAVVERYEVEGVRGGEVEAEYLRLNGIAKAAQQFAAERLDRESTDCFMVNTLRIYSHYLFDGRSWALDPAKDEMVDLLDVVDHKKRAKEEAAAMSTAMAMAAEKEGESFGVDLTAESAPKLTERDVDADGRTLSRLVLTHFVGDALFDRFYVFVASFHRHVVSMEQRENGHRFRYKVVVFTDFGDSQFVEELDSISARFSFLELADIRSLQKGLSQRYSVSLNDGDWLSDVDLLNRRFFEYREYLDGVGGVDVDSVFISDSTDVLFRGNVFNLMHRIRSTPDADLEALRYRGHRAIDSEPATESGTESEGEYFVFFMERKGIRIIDSKPNMNWIEQCFGRSVMIEEFGHRPICCAGTMMGTAAAVQRYLQILSNLFVERHAANIAAKGWDQCLKLPSDQGLHNVVLHRHSLDHLGVHSVAIPNDHHWIMQMTLMLEPPRYTDSELLQFVNRSCVVHQYKRHKLTEQMALTEYNYTEFRQQK